MPDSMVGVAAYYKAICPNKQFIAVVLQWVRAVCTI